MSLTHDEDSSPFAMVCGIQAPGSGEVGVLYGFYEGDAGDETD